MPGVIYRAVEKKVFDFGSLAASQTVLIVGAKALDVSQYREVNIIARLHAIPGVTNGVNWPTGASVTLSARLDAPTAEDPADFFGTTDLGAPTTVAFTQGTDTPPAVKAFMLSGGGNQTFGAWLRIYVKGTTAATSGTFQVMLSVDVNAKS
jgi:hypothetical protein